MVRKRSPLSLPAVRLCLFATGLGLALTGGLWFVLVASAAPPAQGAPTSTPALPPLVFVPGITGSRLLNTEGSQQDVEVWANVAKLADPLTIDNPLLVMRLAPDGASPYKNELAYTSMHTVPGAAGIVTTISGAVLGYHIQEPYYQTVIEHFLSLGYQENVNFWAFPYDWRKDLRPTADALDVLVDAILSQTGAGQVTIVAHSMGGLVTRQYLSDPARAAKVQRAVLLGTPFLGTPMATTSLRSGGCMLKLPVLGLCLPRPAVLQALLENFPGGYVLNPSNAYFQVKGGGFHHPGSLCRPNRRLPKLPFTRRDLHSGEHFAAEHELDEQRPGFSRRH